MKQQYYIKKKQLQKLKKEISKFKISTSKLLIDFLFLNCTAIEIFTGYITIENIKLARELMITPDFSPLIALISAVIGETIGFFIYSSKAAKENCKGGIVYEQAMAQLNNYEQSNG